MTHQVVRVCHALALPAHVDVEACPRTLPDLNTHRGGRKHRASEAQCSGLASLPVAPGSTRVLVQRRSNELANLLWLATKSTSQQHRHPTAGPPRSTVITAGQNDLVRIHPPSSQDVGLCLFILPAALHGSHIADQGYSAVTLLHMQHLAPHLISKA